MNENQSSVAAAILQNYVRPVKKPKAWNGSAKHGTYAPLTKDQAIQKFLWGVEFHTSGCWLFKGHVMKNGYGQTGVNGKVFLAHRFSYSLFIGEIPDGHLVCHRCDVRNCVNPDHLFVGSEKMNTQDMLSKLRQSRKLEPEDALEIYEMVHSGSATKSQLAERFGVTRQCIHLISKKKTWKHLLKETDNERQSHIRRFESAEGR